MSDEAPSEVKPLSEIFGAKPEPAKAPEPAKVDPDPKSAEPPAADGKGDKDGGTPPPAADEKKPDDTPPPKKDDPIKAMRKALSATQRELQELRNQRQQQERQTKAPDPIADAEGYAKHIHDQVGERLWQERLADAHEEMSEKLGDALDETLETFTEMMQARPQLYAEWRAARNPGKFLMKAVEDHRRQQEVGDPVAFADRIRAETLKSVDADIDRRIAEGVKKALGQHLPQSLADERTQGGKGSDAEPAEFRRKSLDSILSNRR